MSTISRRRAIGMFASAAGAAGLASLQGASLLYAGEEALKEPHP